MKIQNIYSTLILIFCISNLMPHNFTDTLSYNHSLNEICNNLLQKKKYKITKKFLDNYKRPFTVLDVYPHNGSFAVKITQKYDAVYTILERDKRQNTLLSICKKNKQLHNLILLKKTMLYTDFERLCDCEHFDVILLHNSISQFGPNWQNFLDIIFTMGDNIIIETSNTHGDRIAKKYLMQHNAILMGNIDQPGIEKKSKLYLIKKSKKYIKRVNWLFPPLGYKTHFIHSNFNEKKLIKITEGKIKITDWLPGINLITFKMCNGMYPDKETLKNAIKKLKDFEHDDWEPNNMIIQGNNTVLIDYDDKRGRKYSIDKLKKILMLIDLDDPKKITDFFFTMCVRISQNNFTKFYAHKQRKSFEQSKKLFPDFLQKTKKLSI